MDNIALSTIGVKVSYAVEETAGIRPITQYTHIKGLFSTPDFNIAPSTADATTFENKEYTTKLPLLKEIPDTLEFGARMGQVFKDMWKEVVAESKTGRETGKQTWFCIDIPDLDESIFFTGEPISMGMSAMEVNSGIDTSVFIVPTGEPILADDPTYVTEL